MPRSRVLLLTMLALLAFAANSLLCRLALRETGIDPVSFTAIRILSGALALWLIVMLRPDGTKYSRPPETVAELQGTSEERQGTAAKLPLRRLQGNWPAALALFVYAIAFSLAYVGLSAATGALLLFGAVQVTMLASGLIRGERLSGLRLCGFLLASAGLLSLLLPGLERPPLLQALFMLAAGVAWGVYSLRGRSAADPVAATAGNFALALPWTIVLGLAAHFLLQPLKLDGPGAAYALVSGAVTSGLGYVVWYAALRGLKSTEAATVQLSVPVIAALGAVVLLGEQPSLRLLLCGIAVLGGIALVIAGPVTGNIITHPTAEISK